MRLLRDTHAFLWWATAPDRLPGTARSVIEDPAAEIYLSAASAWEVRIKQGIGRLRLDEPWVMIVEREVNTNGLRRLPVTFSHTNGLEPLPPLHRDPFDRILIAQALVEEMTLVSGDAIVREYPDVRVVWE